MDEGLKVSDRACFIHIQVVFVEMMIPICSGSAMPSMCVLSLLKPFLYPFLRHAG